MPADLSTLDATAQAELVRSGEASPVELVTSTLGEPPPPLDDGLPIGIQLVGDLGREDLLIQVAAQIEEARPWADRRPPLFAAAVS